MNTIISRLRKAITLAVLTIALIGGSLVTRAAGGHDRTGNDSTSRDNTPAGSARTAEVTYLGGNAGEMAFKVVYNNTTGSRFSLKVLDADGNQLYQHFYSDTNFDKTFKVANADNYGKLTFVIRNFGDNSTQSFVVSSNTRLVEDVEVKEVK
ncbi:MAG TPA: hypothetical protein VGM30_08840 [Puia sp.]|jgi:hypothetical protein